MSKTLTIRIKPAGEVLEDFRQAFEAVQAGRRVTPREGVYFSSIEAVRNFLTRERLALLRAIRTSHPGSIYELAKIVNRDIKNVQGDVKLLRRHGLVRLSENRRGPKSKVKVPEAPFDEIALRITI